MWSRISSAISIYQSHAVPLSLISAVSLPLTFVNQALVEVAPATTLLLVPFEIIIGSIVTAALIRATDAALAGAQPSFTKTYELIIRRLKPLVEVELRSYAAALGLAMTIIGIPWAIRLFVRWFFATYALVIESLSPKEAISRSCEIVKGRWWHTLGLLMFPLFITIPLTALQLLLSPPILMQAAISIALALFLHPILVAYWTNLYFELKERPEAAPKPDTA